MRVRLLACRSESPEEDGVAPRMLNPLAKYLGPAQRRLHGLLVVTRILQRVVTWEDRVLTAQVRVRPRDPGQG